MKTWKFNLKVLSRRLYILAVCAMFFAAYSPAASAAAANASFPVSTSQSVLAGFASSSFGSAGWNDGEAYLAGATSPASGFSFATPENIKVMGSDSELWPDRTPIEARLGVFPIEPLGSATTLVINTSVNSVAPVPEPSTLLLVGTGLIGAVAVRIRLGV